MDFKVLSNYGRTALKIAAKFLLLLPIPLFMIWVNFTVDRSGYFQGDQFERETAQALLEGHNLSHYEKMDERQIVRLYVQNLPQEQIPSTIALGSSRVLQINTEIAGDENFFNAGMIGADVRDVMSTFYLFAREDKLPKNVILSIDPWLFSGKPDALDSRADNELFQEFLSEGLGIHSDYEAPDSVDLWKVLTDPAYFQGNVAYYFRDKSDTAHPVVVSGDDMLHQDTEVKCSDGSVVYTEEFRTLSHEQIDALAVEQGGTALRLDFDQLDPGQIELFDSFIQYGRQRGVNFVFVLIPYHPLTYYVIQQNHSVNPIYSGFFQVEDWLRQYAAEQNIPIYGSYDGESLGLIGDDFYDGLHCRGTAIASFFPGMQAILAQQSGAQLT